MSQARTAAGRMGREEGDAICAQVLALARRVVRGAPTAPVEGEGLDPVPTTAESRWLDRLDSATRSGLRSYGQP